VLDIARALIVDFEQRHEERGDGVYFHYMTNDIRAAFNEAKLSIRISIG
jgi:hypothetical protein